MFLETDVLRRDHIIQPITRTVVSNRYYE